MFKSTIYSLVKVPLKKGGKPGTNQQIDAKVPSDEMKAVEHLRNGCIEMLDRFRKQHDNVRGLDGFLSTEGEREKYAAAITNSVEGFAAALIDLVKRHPKFGIVQYYVWSSSLGDKQDIAYDDYRYDLSCMYYNCGAMLLNLAQYVLCVRTTVGAMASLEKEVYRILLRAAGCFSVAASIVSDMKQEPIGVAQVPLPFDSVIATLSFLELVSLAQAQEIGTNRAADADPKGEHDTTARLCHQTFILYQKAKDTAQGISTHSKDFQDVSVLVMVKTDIYKALAYSYAASATLQKTPADSMWLITKANQHAETVQGYKSRKVKVSFEGDKCVDDCLTTVRRNAERVTKINSLVHRAKPSAGIVSLPPPQVLAQKVDLRLPTPLPPASASASAPPPPVAPPETLSATETGKGN